MKRTGSVFAFVLIYSSMAGADVPTYSTLELQARANFCGNPGGSFNLPCSTFFANATPVVNDVGQVTMKLDVVGASQGIWFGSAGVGAIAYTSPSGASLSDPWVNNAGYVVFPQTSSPSNGIKFYDNAGPTNGHLTTQPFGATSWGSVAVNNAGEVGYRATFPNGQAFYSYAGPSSVLVHALEAGLEPSSPYSFLFSPAFNNNRQIAAHVRLGAAGQTGNNQPDQILIFNSDGSSILIAEDVNSNAQSPYSGFDSSRPALTDDGRVAFIANLVAGGRGVFLSDGKTTTTIATTTGGQGITTIEFFPPHVNNDGLVVFRAQQTGSLDAVYVGDGKTLRRIVGEHDIVPTDQGPARVDQNDRSLTFGGSVTINNQGDVAFHCTLTPPDNNQIEWGSGIFIAYADPASVPGDITGNGIVDVDDLLAVINAWGSCPKSPVECPADIAPDGGNGAVDVDDLLMVINNWG
jgi:hypothetical protein